MRSLGTTLSFAIAACLFLSTAPAQAQDTWLVNDDGTAGNGCASWPDACPDLQTALGLADDGDEIWVAEGTYTPAGAGGAREATFQLISGVAIYGGFDGTEDALEERAGLFDQTILSGDLKGDDTPVACTQNAPDCDSFGRLCVDNFCIISDNNAENSYHVTTGSGTNDTALLDGFTITAGNADGALPDNLGGGMFNTTGAPTVANSTFLGNAAVGGGGMENRNASSPTVTSCTFSENWASSLGGGMQNFEGSHPVLTNCTFNRNVAGSGGGMDNFFSSPMLTDCTFSGNVGNLGGGMWSRTSSNPVLTNCMFIGNSAIGTGGGMEATLNSRPTLRGCTFSGNSARMGGGGMELQTGSGTTITDCTFSGNTSLFGRGGGIDIFNSSPTISHCTFSGNTARDTGGGMFNWNGSSPTVTHCTFSGNSADRGGGMANNVGSPTVTHCTFSGNSADIEGGGMYNANSSNPTVVNSILWGDSAPNGPEIYIINNSDPAIVSVAYSDIEGGEDGVVVEGGGTLDWGDGNIDSDPLFVDPDGDDDEVGTEDDNLRLSPGSPCIDAAKNELVPADTFDCDDNGNTEERIPCDLDGNPRFVDDLNTEDCQQAPDECGAPPVVDMGAFEFQGSGLVVHLDIKPGACPNPFNRHGDGVLPVALVGTAEFDPTEVDLSTLQLSRADGVGGSVAPNEGPPGPHSEFEDVGTPLDGETCDCHELEGDGIVDLSMKFQTQELMEALELDSLPGGAVVELELSGSLVDGTPFNAGDCIVIVP
ncbi:MAG: right-handed parallel beta-helix repeat-containing protein [Planctomycetota bacterium]|nr:right-handed parallel beta-helix repeat-containing protein [Planctomycetota bacterium]